MIQSMLIGRYTVTKGISIYQFKDGELIFIKDTKDIINPSYLCHWEDKIYALTETTGSASGPEGGITVYRTDKKEVLQPLWSHKQGFLGSCHITLDPSKELILLGNYGAGSFSASYEKSYQQYDSHLATIIHTDSTQENRRSHVHYVCFTPDEQYVCVVDLGLDSITGYKLIDSNQIIQFEKVFVSTFVKGTGPRHMCFHNNKKYAYICGELNSTIVVMEYVGKEGLREVQTISSLANPSTTPSYPSAIKLSSDSKFLYIANRGVDTISVFQVDSFSGRIALVQEINCKGKFPRDFTFDLTEHYMVVANQNSNNLTVFQRDSHTGFLTYHHSIEDVEAPTCVLIYLEDDNR